MNSFNSVFIPQDINNKLYSWSQDILKVIQTKKFKKRFEEVKKYLFLRPTPLSIDLSLKRLEKRYLLIKRDDLPYSFSNHLLSIFAQLLSAEMLGVDKVMVIVNTVEMLEHLEDANEIFQLDITVSVPEDTLVDSYSFKTVELPKNNYLAEAILEGYRNNKLLIFSSNIVHPGYIPFIRRVMQNSIVELKRQIRRYKPIYLVLEPFSLYCLLLDDLEKTLNLKVAILLKEDSQLEDSIEGGIPIRALDSEQSGCGSGDKVVLPALVDIDVVDFFYLQARETYRGKKKVYPYVLKSKIESFPEGRSIVFVKER